jgi:hypothetical protein
VEDAQCIEDLLAACPGLRPHWDEHHAWWGECAGRVPFERLARRLGPEALAACRRLEEKLDTRTPGL